MKHRMRQKRHEIESDFPLRCARPFLDRFPEKLLKGDVGENLVFLFFANFLVRIASKALLDEDVEGLHVEMDHLVERVEDLQRID